MFVPRDSDRVRLCIEDRDKALTSHVSSHVNQVSEGNIQGNGEIGPGQRRMRKAWEGSIGDAIAPKDLHRDAVKFNGLCGASRVPNEVVVDMNA